jgi:hypothetical protein
VRQVAVAPKKTNASEMGVLHGRLLKQPWLCGRVFQMSAKLITHGGQNFVSEVSFTPRVEPLAA